MPSRNVVREFVSDSVYHTYNRGVEKRTIFMDQQDYGVFLNRLKHLLADPTKTLKRADEVGDRDKLKSYYGDIELLAYCLMPNHFHLLLYQRGERTIQEFMSSLSTSYTMYFNLRYKRVGSLFQGSYKAKLVKDEAYWQHISRYIHLNPEALSQPIFEYPYSSLHWYKNAVGKPSWLKPDRVLEVFDGTEDYIKFVQQGSGHLEQIAQDYSLE